MVWHNTVILNHVAIIFCTHFIVQVWQSMLSLEIPSDLVTTTAWNKIVERQIHRRVDHVDLVSERDVQLFKFPT